MFHKVGKHYQFSPIADRRYYKVEVTDFVREAVDEAYIGEDTTKGALFFCAKYSSAVRKWKRIYQYLFIDEVGHMFFK